MRLGTRIFIAYFVIVIGCVAYPIRWILNTMDTRYREGVEDPLVDQANILAALVGLDMEDQQFDPKRWHLAFDQAYARPLSARIYSLTKTYVDLRVYITDTSGQVLFDSKYPENEGSDFSLWRDVHLTLQEKYGARSTPETPENPNSPATLYVAAPIMVRGEVVGALSVSKPSTNINTFLKSAKPQIIMVSGLSGIVAILLSFLIARWLTRPIKRLTLYANAVRGGQRAQFPRLDRSEIGEMGHAFRNMQEALEGKQYVERYVQNLTHEIKSPLSAIRGAAELLQEQLPEERRTRFLENIRQEANRIQQVVDRMLQLATLENLKALDVNEDISFAALIQRAVESKQPQISKKRIIVTTDIPNTLIVKGDPFLLEQAISNLLQNAIEFSPEQGQLELTAQIEAGYVLFFYVDDHGSGIPDYALDKVFDKFFSLQRPDSGKKSTGLGLNFVKEIALLHHGEISLNNRPEGGARATLTLPL